MSVSDMIKKSVLESDMYNQAISFSTIITMVVDLSVALLMGFMIYAIYKKYFKGVIYNRSFAITLVGMTVLTCMVTLAISTNIVISLGMVGALSIVRYRTAIKEPLDLLYLFWAITTGITVGASMYILAVLGAIIMIIMIMIFANGKGTDQTYLCIIHYEGDDTGDAIIRLLGNTSYMLKSKVMRGQQTEMTIQITQKRNHEVIVEKIRNLEQVKDISIVEYNGEYHA